MSRRRSSWVRVVAINLVIVMALIALLEVAARAYIAYTRGSATAGLAERTRYLDYQPFVMFGEDMDRRTAALVGDAALMAPETFRILLVGGSTAQGFPSAVLERSFARRFDRWRFRVINLAQGGFNARQELVAASLWGSTLRPRLLLSLDGANDLTHRLRMRRAGGFYLDDAYRLALTRPFLSPLAELVRHSQLRNGIEALLRRGRVEDVSRYEDAIPVFVGAQRGLNVLAGGMGSLRVMVLQPFVAFKEPKAAAESAFTHYAYREAVVAELYRRTHTALEALARRDGVLYLDGRDLYDGSGDHIFSDDVHFVDARGYEILAERIAELVETAGVMP